MNRFFAEFLNRIDRDVSPADEPEEIRQIVDSSRRGRKQLGLAGDHAST